MLQNMTLTAVVRTLVQWVISRALASAFGTAFVMFVTDELGLNLDIAWVSNTATLLILGIVVALVNRFGKHFAWINQFISLGLSRTGPGYVPNNADAVVIVAKEGEADEMRSIDVPPPGPNDGAGAADPMGNWPRG